MAVAGARVLVAGRRFESEPRATRPASPITVRAASANRRWWGDTDRMIDQDQARKFWTSWVRREIGGSDMIQEAAVSAAVNELLLGHDNQAAADAARNTANRLG